MTSRHAIAIGLCAHVLTGAACTVIVSDDPDYDVQSAQTVTFAPSADATVAQGSPGTNYGTRTDIVSDASPVKWAFVKFDVSGLAGQVTRATLRLHVANGTSDGPRTFT